MGAIGADPGVIVVSKDSKFQSLGELVDAIKAEPGSVAFAGGSATGGFDHLKPLMILQRAGFTDITKVKYIGVDGGADAITQTVGGFTQAMTGDMSGAESCERAHMAAPRTSDDLSSMSDLTGEISSDREELPAALRQLRTNRSRPIRLTGDPA